jgi:hypothetical protein
MNRHRECARSAWAVYLSAWIVLLGVRGSQAGNGTWTQFPASGDWNAAGNWSAGTVPNGAADTATFNVSLRTSVSLSANTEVNGVVFSPGSSTSFGIVTNPALILTISGVGITNGSNSNVTQNFVVSVSGAFGGLTRFTNSASADASSHTLFSTHTVYTSNGGDTSGFAGGTTQFRDTSTAGSALFNANAGTVNGALGGIIEFRNNASGGNGTFTAKGGAITNAVGGLVQFFDTATAGSGAFTTNGSSVIEGNGALTQFFNNSSGGSAHFVNTGDPAFDASAGVTQFLHTSTAGNATFTNNGNTIQRHRLHAFPHSRHRQRRYVQQRRRRLYLFRRHLRCRQRHVRLQRRHGVQWQLRLHAIQQQFERGHRHVQRQRRHRQRRRRRLHRIS